MNRVIIDLEVLHHNIKVIEKWMKKHGATWTLVTKVLCGHNDTLRALQELGVKSMGDSRIDNLKAIDRIFPDFEAWYLRLPHVSVLDQVVTLADVSLNSEIDTIEMLNEKAKNHAKIHRIIIMIELGDLREGILPGSLIDFYNHIFQMSNIEVLGIGANFGCLAGMGASIDQLTQLALYRELLELKFERKLSMISAGSSVVLPLLFDNQVPKSINHFRIGEAVFLGTDLINGGTLKGLRDDAITLEAEVVEIKEKSLVPLGNTTSRTPFDQISEDDFTYGDRGYRAIVTVGQLDTEVAGLRPIDKDCQIAGASSDLTVVNLGEGDHNLRIGDTLKFRANYGALLRLMSCKYIDRIVTPSLETFAGKLNDDSEFAIPT